MAVLGIQNQMEDKLRELKQSKINEENAEKIRDRLAELQSINGEAKSAIFTLLQSATDSISTGLGSKNRTTQCYEWCVQHYEQLLSIVSRGNYLLLCSPITWGIPSLTTSFIHSPFRAFIITQSTFTEIPYSLFSLWAGDLNDVSHELFCTLQTRSTCQRL